MIATALVRNTLFADVPEGRRNIMRAIRSSDTMPERLVRSWLHRAGYRFRKNFKDLPGKPDIVVTSRKKAIFIHGCFWHRHAGCSCFAMPKTRQDYWHEKLEKNVIRDSKNVSALEAAGWEVDVVWECELARFTATTERLARFLGPTRLADVLPAPSVKLEEG